MVSAAFQHCRVSPILPVLPTNPTRPRSAPRQPRQALGGWEEPWAPGLSGRALRSFSQPCPGRYAARGVALPPALRHTPGAPRPPLANRRCGAGVRAGRVCGRAGAQLNSNNRAELGWEGCVGQVDGNRPPEEGAFHAFPWQPLTAESGPGESEASSHRHSANSTLTPSRAREI